MYLSSRTAYAVLEAMRDPESAKVIIKNELDQLHGLIDDLFKVFLLAAGIKLGLDEDGIEMLRLTTFALNSDDLQHVDCRLRIVATAFAQLKKYSPELMPDPCEIAQQKIIKTVERLRKTRFPSAHVPFPTSALELLTPMMRVKTLERAEDYN